MGKTWHTGEVVEIRGEQAVVQLQPDRSCRSAFSCCCASVRPEPRTLRVQGPNLEIGDQVRVGLPALLGPLSALAAFVLPVGLLVAGMAVGSLLEGPGGAHDMPTLIGGACGFGLAVLATLGMQRIVDWSGWFEVRRIHRTDLGEIPQRRVA
ncbi:MAG: SoxR reducing system RseC family protein [Candidatus Brocadiaceae bacterium]|jgi:hypothetical protein